MDVLATLNLVEVAAGGGRRLIKVEVGRPRPDDRGDWVCFVRVDPLDHAVRPTFGVDASQAFELALRLVEAHLDGPRQWGSRLIHEDGSEFMLDDWLDTLSDSDLGSVADHNAPRD